MFKSNKNESLNDFSIISEGMKIDGSIETKGNLRIDGSVTGHIVAGENVTIGEKGIVTGDLKSKTMTIGGKVFGGVNVSDKLILESGCRLTGDIVAKILSIEEGASYSGYCEMNPIVKEDTKQQPKQNSTVGVPAKKENSPEKN